MDNIPPDAYKQQIVKFYNPEEVKKVVRVFTKDEKIQRSQTSKVRRTIADALSSNPTFSVFNSRVSESRLVDILESTCGDSALSFEQNLRDLGEKKLLGVNIIKRLRERYEGNVHELRIFIKQLVDHSGNYVSFNQNEVSKTGLATKGDNQEVKSLSVILPEAPEHPEFLELIVETFRECKPAHIDDIEFIRSNTRPFEITLVSIANLFPLRYLSIIEFLKGKYENRIAKDVSNRARIEIHTDGLGEQFPNLFVPTQNEINTKKKALQKNSIPYLLIADGMNNLQKVQNPETGIEQFAILRKDEDGFDLTPLFLGKEFINSYENMEESHYKELKNMVEIQLSKEYKHENKRNTLKESIKEKIAEVKATRNDNISDEIYQLYNNAGRKAFELLKTLNR